MATLALISLSLWAAHSGDAGTVTTPVRNSTQQAGAVPTEAASSLQRYEKNDRYIIHDIDANLDGVSDKVVSSAQNAGNELLVFVNSSGSFKLALTSINLTEDGGRILGEVRPETPGKGSDVFSIETYFPQGQDVAKHFVSFQNNQWILSRTELEISDWRERPSLVYLCEVAQGIPMESLVSSEDASRIRQIPDESLRQKECRIKR